MVNMNNTFVSRLRKVAGIEVKEPLDLGLSRINARLGMHGNHGGTDHRKPAKIRVEHTEARARSIFFAPDMDGQADSGEVVWVWAPTEGPSSGAKKIERARRSEEHTSELQSRGHLVCRLLLERKKNKEYK